MLDSLVRVSRRVGWGADRTPLTPCADLGSTVAPTPHAVYQHCKQFRQVGRTTKGNGPEPEGGHGRSSVAPAGRFQQASTSHTRNNANYLLTFWPPGNRSRRYARGKCTHQGPPTKRPVLGIWTLLVANQRRVEFLGPNLRFHPFASRRFHVLLNSLFKVLFNFPSRYLSAIGLVSVFSLRWSLPPALGCIPKQPDSEDAQSHRAAHQ
jgi:hypothetical protein